MLFLGFGTAFAEKVMRARLAYRHKPPCESNSREKSDS